MKKGFLFFSAVILTAVFSLAVLAEASPREDIKEALEGMSGTYDLENLLSDTEKAQEHLLPDRIFSFAMSLMGKSAFDISGLTLALIAVIFIASVTEVYKQNLGETGKLSDLASLLCTMVICFKMSSGVIDAVSQYLSGFVSFMSSMSGAASVLLVSSGNPSASMTSSASASFIIGLIQICSVHIILPCVRVIIALSAITTLSRSVDLSGIISFIKSFCSWGLGVLFAIFGGIHSVAVSVAGGADSLAVRGIRFSAARLIPVAGNMISESMKTVISGMNVIKNTAGGLGIAYIIYTLLPAITAVLCVKLAVMAGIFASKLFGVHNHTSFLEGFNAALNILMSVCMFASVSGIVIFAVFMNTTSSI